MGKVERVKREVRKFSPKELAEFRQWFAGFDAEAWDQQFESDAKAGRLDALAERALRNHAADKSSKL